MLFIFLPALAESFKYSLEFAAIKFNYIEQEYIGFENYVEAVTNDTDFYPCFTAPYAARWLIWW